MRHNAREIELKLDSIFCVGIGADLDAIFPPRFDVCVSITGATLRAAFSGSVRTGKLRHARAQIVHRNFIERKYACERAPLGGHVGDRHARRHRKIWHAIADEFDSVIEHLVFVEQSA